MQTAINISSNQLSTEDLRALLQSIRDCEVANFPDKFISIFVEVPELTSDVLQEILTKIQPPFKYGPMVFKSNARSWGKDRR